MTEIVVKAPTLYLVRNAIKHLKCKEGITIQMLNLKRVPTISGQRWSWVLWLKE
jgi:hypothetical protein